MSTTTLMMETKWGQMMLTQMMSSSVGGRCCGFSGWEGDGNGHLWLAQACSVLAFGFISQ